MFPSGEILQDMPLHTRGRRFRSEPPFGDCGNWGRCAEPSPPPRIYLASPLSTYRTPRYDAVLALIEARYPHAELLPARSLFQSNEEWRQRWPGLLATLTDLVFFAVPDGSVGLGVWCEVQDAADRMPVWFVDAADHWHPLDSVALDITGESLARFATIRIRDPEDTGRANHAAMLTGGA